MTSCQLAVHVVEDRFHAAPHEVGLVPEPGAGRVAQEVLPPLLMRQLSGPALQGIEVAPLLPHPDVRRYKGVHQVLVEQKAVGTFAHSGLDLASGLEHLDQASHLVDRMPR
jgi:hypothetical protein